MVFNLEQAIGDWRAQMLAAGIKSPTPLDELENHLRDDVEQQVSSGVDAQKAFARAVSNLGSPATMGAEFSKVQAHSSVVVKIGSLIWIAALVLLAMFLLTGLLVGRMNFLLFTHILTLTTGYGAALLTGGFAIYFVWSQRMGTHSAPVERALNRAVSRFTHLSTGLVVVGVLTGVVWSQKHSGQIMGPDSARAIGPFGVCIWLVALCLLQRRRFFSSRDTMLLSIGSNLLVGLAWFGVALFFRNPGVSGSGIGSYALLAAFVAIHLFFLRLGQTQQSEAAKT